jgi:hypothetical protein
VNTFVVVTAFDAYKLPVTLMPVTPVAGVTTTFEATTLPKCVVAVTAFEAYKLPVTLRLVRPVRPAMVWIPVAVTFVVKTFVVVTAFDAYMLPVTFKVVAPVLPRMYNVSKFAGSVTVKAYPGELTV